MGGTRLISHLRSVRGFYGSFTDCKSDLQAVIVTYRQVGGLLKTQLGGQLGKDFLCVLYVFPLCFYGLFMACEQDSRPV